MKKSKMERSWVVESSGRFFTGFEFMAPGLLKWKPDGTQDPELTASVPSKGEPWPPSFSCLCFFTFFFLRPNNKVHKFKVHSSIFMNE